MAEAEKFPEGVALVFGASGGIGGEISRVLAADGADLALVYNSNADAAQSVAQDVEKAGRKSSVHQCDLLDADSIAALVAAVEQERGRIHTIVWAAGPLVEQIYISKTPMETWRHAFEIETYGLINAVTALIPHLREHGGGSVVHLGSAGHHRFPDRDGLSVIPKAANEAFLKGIAREEGRYGIRANSVTVGVIEAGMFKALMAKGAFPEGWTEETQKNLCLKRWGQPEEIGYAVSFLASNRAAYVTGQIINVAGGYGV